MSNDAEVQQKQLEGMTAGQLEARITQNLYESQRFIEHLVNRATVQEYTEQQYEEQRTLLQEAHIFIERVPVTPELVEMRNELLGKLKRKL